MKNIRSTGNERFWHQVQGELFDFLAHFHTDGTYLWSMKAGDYVKVGNTFDSYEFGGNIITFAVDRTFSREYGYDKGYALCLDLTADKSSSQPPIKHTGRRLGVCA